MPTNSGVSEVVDKHGVTADIEAKRFDGTRTVQIQGDVTASQTWNGDSSYPLTLNASIGAKKVTQDKIGDKAVGSGQMADGSVGLTQMDPNAMTSSATSGDTRLITAGGVRTEIDNAILNRGKDYGPMTPTQINAISETIPTGSTVHVTAAGTITDGDIEVRQGEDLKYYRSGNTHYWYSMDGDFKLKQQAKTSPTASGNALSFIDSITQDENGEITATKKSVQDGTTSQKGVVQLEDSHSSTSTTTAATPNSVKSAYDLANGKYSKPSGGIPKSDLASGVQASLDKADSALQPTGDGKDLTSTVSTENNYTNPGSTATALKTLFGKIWNFIGRLRTSWQTTPDDTHFPSEKLVKDSLDLKADKVSGATNGNFAALDSNGNLTDSGKKASDFELVTNKVTSWQATPDDTHFPSEKLVKDSLDLKAPLASPALTGTPTAPTASNGTNNTQIATTAFVQSALDNGNLRYPFGVRHNRNTSYGYKLFNAKFSTAQSANRVRVSGNLIVGTTGDSEHISFDIVIANIELVENNPSLISLMTTSTRRGSRVVRLAYKRPSNWADGLDVYLLWSADGASEASNYAYGWEITFQEGVSSPGVTVKDENLTSALTGFSLDTPRTAAITEGTSAIGSTSVPVYADENGVITPCTDDFVHDGEVVTDVKQVTESNALKLKFTKNGIDITFLEFMTTTEATEIWDRAWAAATPN